MGELVPLLNEVFKLKLGRPTLVKAWKPSSGGHWSARKSLLRICMTHCIVIDDKLDCILA